VNSFEPVILYTEEGIEKYLAGFVKGVGPKLAKEIVARFGTDAIEIMEKHPERLKEIDGIGDLKFEQFQTSFRDSEEVRTIVSFLGPLGISPKRAVKIYETLGNGAISIIRDNPYRLYHAFKIGFKTVDMVAINIGYDVHSFPRISAGINYVLEQNMYKKGHLFLNSDDLENQTATLLGTNYEEITKQEIHEVIGQMLAGGSLKSTNCCIYTCNAYESERSVARDVIRIIYAPQNMPLRIDLAILYDEIEKTERELGIVYSADQKRAIIDTFSSPCNIITGFPGTGKSTVLKGIVSIVKRRIAKPAILLCSPTGRAARRLSELTDEPAFTIHKALKLLPDDDDQEVELADYDLIVVDEASMLDMFLSRKLFGAIKTGAKFTLVGDPEQLPSVGPGAVFSELIRSGEIPCTALSTIFRQANNSRIIVNEAQIRSGYAKLKFGDDFLHIPVKSCEEAAQEIVKVYLSEILEVGPDNVQVLTPFREKTAAGALELNKLLQAATNPPDQSRPEIHYGINCYRVGDKVMQLKNVIIKHFAVTNGELGFITRIYSTDGHQIAEVDFGDGRIVSYTKGEEMDDLSLAYATTVHKAQGNEYHTVIFNLTGTPSMMLKRNLVYTAITRARERLVYVGKLSSLTAAIKMPDTEKRNTLLADRIVSLVRQVELRYPDRIFPRKAG
jgi:exodeoxyribonuclease V alpha subunit